MSRWPAADLKPNPWPVRRHDWPERLAETVAMARERPFDWGEHDCALFAADCVAAVTGHDPGAWFRGRYSTEVGARRAIRRFCGERGVTAAFGDVLLGPRLASINLAQRGDLVLAPTPTGPAFGVVMPRGAMVAGERGLVVYPLSASLVGWRI